MSYNQAFWFSFAMYLVQMVFYFTGAVAFVKYCLKRDQ